MKKQQLDMNRIAKGLGARRKGSVKVTGGYFGAVQLAADIKERLRVPEGGGRPTDRSWTEKRLLPLAPLTLRRLEEISAKVNVEPMQLAALLVEKGAYQLSEQAIENLIAAR